MNPNRNLVRKKSTLKSTVINPFLTIGLVHPYHSDESVLSFRVA